MAGSRRLDRLALGTMLLLVGVSASWSTKALASCAQTGDERLAVRGGMHDCALDEQTIRALTQPLGGAAESVEGDARVLALLGVPWVLRFQEREQDNDAALREAIVRYRELLRTRYTQEQAPRMWAQTQHDLGRALQLLGEDRMVQVARSLKIQRHRGVDETADPELREHLSRTLTLMREIDLKPVNRHHERAPQASPTETLEAYKQVETQLNAAVAAYRSALKVWTRETHPFHWALTQRNLGTALFALGEPLSNPAFISDAVKAYESALQVWTRDRQPLHWARTQYDLGTALWAYLPTDVMYEESAHLEAASDAFENALQVWTPEGDPFNYIWAQEGLAVMLATIGSIHDNVGDLRAAKFGLRDAYAKLQTIGNARDEDLDRYQMRVRSVQYMLDVVLAKQAEKAKRSRDTWPSRRNTN